MKNFVLILLSLASTHAFACRVQEAQFIAEVVVLERHATGCRTYLHAEKVEMFNPSITCPLVFGEVSGYGIEIGLNERGDCRLEKGDIFSGVLVRIDSGTIELE